MNQLSAPSYADFGNVSSDISADFSAMTAQPVTEVSLSPDFDEYRHAFPGFWAATRKSIAFWAGSRTVWAAVIPNASVRASAAVAWLYMYFVPRSPTHPSGS